MAPEIAQSFYGGESKIIGHPYKIDVFTAGLIIIFFSHKKPAFPLKELASKDFDATAKLEALIEDEELRNFLGKLLMREPTERPNMSEVMVT